MVDEFEGGIHRYEVELVGSVAIRANELLKMSLKRGNELMFLSDVSLGLRDVRNDSKVRLAQWANNLWELRCQRFHTHELGDALCEGSIIR